MPKKYVLMDQFHVDFSAPEAQPADLYSSMRRVLDRREFRIALRRAVQAVSRSYPMLAELRVRVSR